MASGTAVIMFSAPFTDGLTIIRNRGFVQITSSLAADLDFTGAIGLGVVTSEAFAAGVASIPEPFTDADWGGWMVWKSFAYSVDVLDATGTNTFPGWNFEIDSKAMRKVGPNSVAVGIAESQAGAFNVNWVNRMLVKLS